MKPAPPVRTPGALHSDLQEATQLLGKPPAVPVGCVVSGYGLAQLREAGAKFPCPVRVDPTAHRESITWIWLERNFAQFTR